MNILIMVSVIVLILAIGLLTYTMRNRLKKWQQILTALSLLFLTFFEFFHLGSVPGFFGDEAYAMYDSWSIAHYGIDRSLMHNAVYSLTSGGQSVLYEHLAAPLMKIFGMNLAAFRFPMALLTIISIIVLVYAVYRNKLNSNIIVGIAFTMSTAQWFLMHCHWAMDCSIIAPMFILTIDFILLGLTGKKYHLYIGFILMTLLAYCYIGVWIALPFMYIFTLFFLKKKEKISKKDIIALVIISLIILVPILSYTAVQFLGLPAFKFLWFTVAPLPATRAANSLISFKGNVLNTIISNITAGLSALITGVVNTGFSSYTSIPKYQLFYLINFIFLIYAIIKTWKNYNQNSNAVNYLIGISITMVPIIILVQSGFWHWPTVYILTSLWSGIGLGLFFKNCSQRAFKIFILGLLLIETGLFTGYYFGNYTHDEIKSNQLGGYSIDVKQSKHFINELKKLKVDTYYGMPFYDESYMGCLIPTNPHNLNNLNGKWQSSLPNTIQPGSAAYIVPANQVNNYPNLQSLPSKNMEVNYVKYVVFYNQNSN
ncbi:hypothetical protein [Ligilactobacillus aviarius]|uniref:hypothetical protein n=1 Tax=Ligilactobacillus aviarius TaxID=1606 RepID=UPI0024BB4198|nr:hypothetical protein [Ligilactobacillus aviarius]